MTLYWCFFETQGSFGFKEPNIPIELNYFPFRPLLLSEYINGLIIGRALYVILKLAQH
jgi:hypothetical protein